MPVWNLIYKSWSYLMSANGKVAIVEIAAPDGTVASTLVEISLGGETLTISDQAQTMTDDIRELAIQLVQQVRSHYGRNTDCSGRGPT